MHIKQKNLQWWLKQGYIIASGKVKNNKLYPHNAYQAKELTIVIKARVYNCKPEKLKTTNFIHTMHIKQKNLQ